MWRRSNSRERISELEERVRALTEKLESMRAPEEGEPTRSGARTHIHIEHMNVDRPVLESLLFRLDRLDIKDLSGTLNLGNNFDAGRKDKALSSDSIKPDGREEPGPTRSEPPSGMTATDSGFSVRMPRGRTVNPG